MVPLSLPSRLFQLNSNNGPVQLHIEDGISQESLKQWEEKWKPILNKNKDKCEDYHWPWIDIKGEIDNRYCFGFSLFHNNECQAMMTIKTDRFMRGAREGGKECVYIAFIAIAPWHRRCLQDQFPESYKPVGRCLVYRAIEASSFLGYGGRLAWHSLPGAVNAYKGMFSPLDSMGIDEDEGLEWYEVGQPAAARFRADMQPLIVETV